MISFNKFFWGKIYETQRSCSLGPDPAYKIVVMEYATH